VTRSYAEHLRAEHHAAEVRLALRRHYVPWMTCHSLPSVRWGHTARRGGEK
jgi:hypothetical protein